MASAEKPEASTDEPVALDLDDDGSGAPPASRSSSLVDSTHADGFSDEEGTQDRLRRANLVREQSMSHLHSSANVDDTNVERRQAVKLRNETAAMGFWDRSIRHIVTLCHCGRKKEEPTKKDDDIGKKTQYTIRSKSQVKVAQGGFLRQCLGRLGNCICFGSGYKAFGSGSLSKLGRAFVNHLNWMFRTSFLVFFVYSMVWFYALVIFFTGFITASGIARPECVLVGGEKFGHADTRFSDAFSLSWHTFSTVGYGSAYPALSGDNGKSDNVCTVISLICVIESFVGVMYAAMIGSILFGKMARIQSRAQVVFSDPLLVRYGAGVTSDEEEDDDDEKGEGKDRRLPCPVLEFRIANLLHDETAGEILDASINVVASLDAEGADAEVREGAHTTAAGLMKALMDHSKQQSDVESTQGSEFGDLELGNTTVGHAVSSNTNAMRTGFKKSSGLRFSAREYLKLKATELQEFDEDPDHELAQRRIFTHLVLDSPEHPYFKRVWLVRHVLDGHSPLLNVEVRRRIRKNGGHWPCELSNAEKVRESLQFNQILVSLTGILNVSGSDVYAQKIYDYVDLAIGYQFVNLLYKGQDDNLKVDLDLVNDVREQRNGGGEDLMSR